MSNYYEILQGFTVEEMHSTDQQKQAIRACVDLLLSTSEDFPTATMLATLLLANNADAFVPSEDFVEKYPDNHPSAYSGPTAYVAFYLLYLAEKARSISEILAEKSRCGYFTASCAQDQDSCGRCQDRAEINIPIDLMRYEDVPPYHIGCRCRPLLLCSRS